MHQTNNARFLDLLWRHVLSLGLLTVAFLVSYSRYGGKENLHPYPAHWVLLNSWSLWELTVDLSPRACRAGQGKGSQASRFTGSGLHDLFQPSPCSLFSAEPRVLGTSLPFSHLFPASWRSLLQTNSEFKG